MVKILAICLVILGCVAAWLFYSNKELKSDLTAANAEITNLTASVLEMKNIISTYAVADRQAKDFERELNNDKNVDNLDVVPADYILKQLHAD